VEEWRATPPGPGRGYAVAQRGGGRTRGGVPPRAGAAPPGRRRPRLSAPSRGCRNYRRSTASAARYSARRALPWLPAGVGGQVTCRRRRWEAGREAGGETTGFALSALFFSVRRHRGGGGGGGGGREGVVETWTISGRF